MKKILHKQVAAGNWSKLSLMEQLANIGSEVGRAGKWQNKDKNIFWGAIERALELFDLTLEDIRWQGRLGEIARARELFCGAIDGGKEYKTTFKDLERYFFYYALCVRRKN